MSSSFTASVFQNEFLHQGADEVHAIMTVETAGGTAASSGSKLVFGIMIDCSGSMGDSDGGRLRHAKQAVREIVKLLREDCLFFIVAGSDVANVIVPLAPATPANKDVAENEVSLLQASGGTTMWKWLNAA